MFCYIIEIELSVNAAENDSRVEHRDVNSFEKDIYIRGNILHGQ